MDKNSHLLKQKSKPKVFLAEQHGEEEPFAKYVRSCRKTREKNELGIKNKAGFSAKKGKKQRREVSRAAPHGEARTAREHVGGSQGDAYRRKCASRRRC